MKNDSTRGGRKISIPPSLLFSVISKMDDVSKTVSPELKKAGDIVYVLGATKAELGGSEYFNMLDATGNKVPQVDADTAIALYNKVSKACEAGLINSMITPALGGMAVACAKSALGGDLGMEIDLGAVPCEGDCSAAEVWFSETNSRFVVTVSAEKRAAFEAALSGSVFAAVGVVTDDKLLKVTGKGTGCDIELDALRKSYKTTLDRV